MPKTTEELIEELRELELHEAANAIVWQGKEIQRLSGEFGKAIMAVHAVYYAAHWSPDRLCNAEGLWTAVRDAFGFEPGNSPRAINLAGFQKAIERFSALPQPPNFIPAHGHDWKLSEETEAAIREIDENIALAPSRIRGPKA